MACRQDDQGWEEQSLVFTSFAVLSYLYRYLPVIAGNLHNSFTAEGSDIAERILGNTHCGPLASSFAAPTDDTCIL